MPQPLIFYENDFKEIVSACEMLYRNACARSVFLIERNGQLLASAGETDAFDATSIASLTAGNMAATDGLAKLIGEPSFGVQFHEGEQEHIHISAVGDRMILVVIFDARSSLGLVRLRVKQVSQFLESMIDRVLAAGQRSTPDIGITDSDIDRLFEGD